MRTYSLKPRTYKIAKGKLSITIVETNDMVVFGYLHETGKVPQFHSIVTGRGNYRKEVFSILRKKLIEAQNYLVEPIRKGLIGSKQKKIIDLIQLKTTIRYFGKNITVIHRAYDMLEEDGPNDSPYVIISNVYQVKGRGDTMREAKEDFRKNCANVKATLDLLKLHS